MTWAPMITDRDAGGLREFVAGIAVNCGTTLFLQAREYFTFRDKLGETREDIRALETHVVVRFEIAYLRKFVRTPVPCDHCTAPDRRCGCRHELTCCNCAGTGDMSGIFVGPRPGDWQNVRTPMLHHVTGLAEFTAPVESWMRFRWPRYRAMHADRMP